MKKIIIALLCLLLSACANVVDINNDLDKIFKDNSKSIHTSNNYSKYLEYYLPSDVYEVSSNETEFVFETADCKLIMNINIPNIINMRFYKDQVLKDEGFFKDENKVYETRGEFSNPSNEPTAYFFKMYKHDDVYLLHLATSELNLYGYAGKAESVLLAGKMFELAKACDVAKSDIVNDFSNKNVIDYTRKSIDLFKTYFPESGRVDDLIIEDSLVD